MRAVEVASNAKAISQSTSDGLNRHTKRVGVIFKTEDGTPAGILNNRRGRAERKTAGPEEATGWQRGMKEGKKSQRYRGIFERTATTGRVTGWEIGKLNLNPFIEWEYHPRY